jgi:glutamate--cysteine ligase
MSLSPDSLGARLQALSPERLAGMRRGVEKESLRANADGMLALTPHPRTLGSALTHPCITTDFSESQLELITAAHAAPADCARELLEIHQFVAREIGELAERTRQSTQELEAEFAGRDARAESGDRRAGGRAIG